VLPVETLLAYPKIVRRCQECHGRLRLHNAGPENKWGAHAEHYPQPIGFDGCSLSHYFKGKRRKHPKPIAMPKGNEEIHLLLLEELLLSPAELVEGAAVTVIVNAYERNPKARAACLRHYGRTCFVCGFDFRKAYGDAAQKIIHVHHIKPLRAVGSEHTVDPVRELRPVCPNCHTVIHCTTEPLTVEQVKAMLLAPKFDEAGKSPPRSMKSRQLDA
jgi:hypothetical protein